MASAHRVQHRLLALALLAAACCSIPAAAQYVRLKARVSTGPFGAGTADGSGVFDDTALSSNGAKPITKVEVRGGNWIDAIKFSYGGVDAPWRGGPGGTARPALQLAADEYITQAWVRSGSYVDEVKFVTNKGQQWSSGASLSGFAQLLCLIYPAACAISNNPSVLASPCPQGAYKLLAVKGTGKEFLERIDFVWALVDGAQAPLTTSVASWKCQHMQTGAIAIRKDVATGQPQCLSTDGKSCLQSSDCLNMFLCADTWQTLTCATSDGSKDPTHWCTRARNTLGIPAPGVPIRVAFFNVNICNNVAVPDRNTMLNVMYNDPHSLRVYWYNSSFSRAYFNQQTSGLFNLNLPCNSYPVTDCTMDKWVSYVKANPSVLGTRKLEDFQIMVFIAPKTAACEKVGIGYCVGSNVWIRSDFSSELNIFKHEIGHALSLMHSSRVIPPSQNEEYGDLSNPMGCCHRCIYSAPHQLQLGWSPSTAPIDWANVLVGKTFTYSLKPMVDKGQVVVIRLADPAEPRAGGARSTNHLFISYRVRKRMDATMPSMFDQATLVHGANGNTWLLAWLKSGRAYVNTANKLVVHQASGDTTVGQIRVCKYKTDPAECGSFSIFTNEDAANFPAFCQKDLDSNFVN